MHKKYISIFKYIVYLFKKYNHNFIQLIDIEIIHLLFFVQVSYFTDSKVNLSVKIRESANLQLHEIYKILHRKKIINISSPVTSVVSLSNFNLSNVCKLANIKNDNLRYNEIKQSKENNKVCNIISCSHLHCQMSTEEQLKVIEKILYNK
jgi:hypothetical protein